MLLISIDDVSILRMLPRVVDRVYAPFAPFAQRRGAKKKVVSRCRPSRFPGTSPVSPRHSDRIKHSAPARSHRRLEMFATAAASGAPLARASASRRGSGDASLARRVGRSPVSARSSARRGRVVALRAAAPDDDEVLSPIELMERRVKGKRSKPKEGYFDSYPTKQSDEPLGLWETDPKAWDAKPALEKAWSAWSGEPGMMFWMNKGSYWGAGILAFIWVLFRLVGPALGLYQLN